MPLFGHLDLDTALASAPTIDSLSPNPWDLPGAEILQVNHEVAEAPALAITPPGLHPSIPPYIAISVYRFPQSPVGPFSLAMVRLIVRAGIRPRGLLIRAFADTSVAADGLRQGWGYDVTEAEVTLGRRHDRVSGIVSIDGRVVLDAALDDPGPIAGSDLELFDSLHLVNVTGNDPVLLQVDPTYAFHTADRGRPRLDRFDTAALGVDGIDPAYAVVAVACTADMTLDAPRFAIDPTRPAVEGTVRLAGPAGVSS